ncbi:MAG: hypothetical protein ACOC97_03610 [Myxococcota bacterium]
MRGTVKLWFAGLIAACIVGTVAADADAQRGRRGKKARVPHSSAISEAMGELEWGMSKEELMRHFISRVHERYRKKFRKVTGAIEEDRLRHRLREAIKRVRQSYVKFDGRTTGWDVSFLRDEFTHRNGEAMIVVKEDQAQNFYFLINNRFWKLYRAFDSEVFAGASFGQFASALEGRYGRAARREGVLHEGGNSTRWLEWQDRRTRLRAVDNTAFYGFYSLVFEDKKMLKRIDGLRKHKRPPRERRHGLVESVTSDVDANPDDNPDIVDRITGKKRN